MNNEGICERRKAINKIIAKLEEVQHELNSCRDLEIEEYKNMPEGLLKSVRGDIILKNAYHFNEMCHVVIGLIARLDYTV